MEQLSAFAGRNHGVFGVAHARLTGLSGRQLERLVASGEVVRVHDEVFRFAAAPVTWRGELLAACWAGGFRAVASHRSAAALWGLAGARRRIPEITCPRWRRARHDGIVVHESRRLTASDITTIDGIPVTTPECTLIGLAAACSASILEMALDRAESRDLVTLASCRAVVIRHSRRGFKGPRQLRALLDGRAPERRTPESEMETRLLQILRANGHPEPVTQFDIPGTPFRADLAYPRWRVVIEYDSYQEHAGRLALARDQHRRLRIQAAGFTVIGVNKADLDSGGLVLGAAIAAVRQRIPAS